MSPRITQSGTTGITGTWRPWPGSQAQNPSLSMLTSVRHDQHTPIPPSSPPVLYTPACVGGGSEPALAECPTATVRTPLCSCREHSPWRAHRRADQSHPAERAPAVHHHLVSQGLALPPTPTPHPRPRQYALLFNPRYGLCAATSYLWCKKFLSWTPGV